MTRVKVLSASSAITALLSAPLGVGATWLAHRMEFSPRGMWGALWIVVLAWALVMAVVRRVPRGHRTSPAGNEAE
jgi:hypothetical protein